LIVTLRLVLGALTKAGCRRVYLDGSFVTSKPEPGDYDACWDIAGVDVEVPDSVFLDFSRGSVFLRVLRVRIHPHRHDGKYERYPQAIE